MKQPTRRPLGTPANKTELKQSKYKSSKKECSTIYCSNTLEGSLSPPRRCTRVYSHSQSYIGLICMRPKVICITKQRVFNVVLHKNSRFSYIIFVLLLTPSRSTLLKNNPKYFALKMLTKFQSILYRIKSVTIELFFTLFQLN